MQQAEQVQVSAAFATLERMRSMQVGFRARWTRLDDLEPEAEQSLKECLQSAWDIWARAHDITDAEVRGPDVTASKLNYIPLTEE